MKRVKNGGFILMETMIVAVFIMAIFVFVYRNSIPMIGRYERLSRFDDLDSVYAANMMKKMVTNYLSFEQIDSLLANTTYVDISNCNDKKLYTDPNYCSKLKNNLQIGNDDIVFITRYNISEMVSSVGKSFRDIAKEDITFDSGSLSNFREYLKTVSDSESFYKATNMSNKAIGLYRLFITRSVPLVDGTIQTKYANIGIYRTTYVQSNIGSVASLKANGPTLVLEIGENYPFTTFLQIQYTQAGGKTSCNPENNATLGSSSREVTCILTEKNGNKLSTHFTVKHGYTPTLESYEYQCGTEECGCVPDENGTIPEGCIPAQCPVTCSGVQTSCYKGGTYDTNTNKCLY